MITVLVLQRRHFHELWQELLYGYGYGYGYGYDYGYGYGYGKS